MTLMFAAPEQARGLPADARSDVFSLAATIYYALLHDKPDLRDPAYFDPDAVPEALRAVLAKAMATNPRHRYADGAEFHAALLAAAAPAESAPFAAPTLPVVLPVARPAAARSPIRKAQQGRPFAVVLSCLGATVALAVVVILIGLGAFNSGVPKKVAQTDKVLNQDAAPKKLISKSPAKSKTPKPGDTISNKLGMKFAWIPPGTFTMGSPPSEQEQAIKDGAPAYRVKGETQHRVTLTKGFYMGVHQVTQAQWRDIMTENPNPSHFKGDSLPVEQVSWFDAVNFCNALSAKEGAKPYYKIDGVKVTILGGTGFRLPTEAEWEYACRAGTKTPFYFGDTISTDQANYAGDYVYGKGKKGVNRQKTTPVGSLPYPNAWGLYDMHGNVWEWCADWYAVYPDGEQVDPQGPTTGDGRVLRGGSFYGNPWFARSANRGRGGPANLLRGIGLRVARTL
ncbi:MAG: SUMF1/EgtB/PvdO family nonheme iron enzyme [Planctomycetes bacterium]|nr:SUMF1/EgtB/PvdO family nonheme iron enzyme [Planctomycetota bacterium]